LQIKISWCRKSAPAVQKRINLYTKHVPTSWKTWFRPNFGSDF